MYSTTNSNGLISQPEPINRSSSNEPVETKIIAESRKLRDVLTQAEMVAPTDCTVLLQGEAGTGKEVVAELVHNRSPRRDQDLIKVNCVAIPLGLPESELPSQDRRAFTRAM